MRLTILTMLLAFIFSKAEAQYPCDIATTGVAIVNANNTAPVSSICVGQHANFKFSLANLGTSPACAIPANSVQVTFDFPTLAGGVKPYVYAGPANFTSGYFSWTYNAGAEVLVGTNTTAIPNGMGDANILVDVIGNTAQTASSNLNITQGMGISDNTSNNTGSAQLTVVASPTVTCPANITGICTNTPAFVLTGGSPSGGTYTGTGVSGGMFNPSVAGVGVHTITYTYTSAANGCAGSCTFTITVTAPPSVTCPSNITGICSNDAAFPLTGATPAGGTYSGPGVSSNTFNPSTAGAGTHTITYSYTSGGCTSTCTFTITVTAAPTVTCRGNITGVCTNSTPFALTGGTPGGGTFSGPGVSANNFDPASAGPGIHTITYSVTSGGCTSTCTFTITVTAAPVVTCPSNMTGVCSNAAAFPLTGATPSGGTYSGTGVSSNTFNPATAGAGTHTITYTYTANGCTSTCTFTITVVAAPSVTCRGNITGVCTNSAPFALTGGAPGGGTFSGPGVSANNFDPAVAGAGTHTITYSVTSGGCTSTCTFTITVDAAPVVTCPSNSTACISSPSFPLTGGSPAGGTYTGPGVSANNFSPSSAGVGTHTITYSYTNTAGCTATCTFTITVTNTATVTCPANITGICTNSAPFILTGGSPAGGTYSGPGVNSNTFNPATAGAGTHTITYTQGAGCPGSCTFTITVTAAPSVSCPQNISGICTNGNSFALTGGLPAGGTYSGAGVSGNNFNPATAGAGTHTITYTVSQGGCSASCTFTITVNNPPVVTCPANTSACINSAPFALTGGTPAGGTYSGPGVSGNMFDPSAAGIGTHTITYSYTSTATGCTNTCTFTITVTSTATVTCPSNISNICVNSAPFVLTGGSPAGGTYSGPGVSSNTFNPANAGVGTHTITYSQGAGCPGSCTFTITVSPQQTVTCPQNISGICTTASPFALTGGLPAGGTYSGAGVSANTFDPSAAGAGTHTITYSYSAGGCTATCTFTITVNTPPVISCPQNMSVCTGNAPFTLNGGSPAGGTYSGTGVNNNVFDPAAAGVGTHTITYTVNSGGCISTCTFTINVTSGTTVTCPSNMSVCLNDFPFSLVGGSPSGGTFSGNGVSGNLFSPGQAGIGTHTITYSVSGNCAGSCTFTITVKNVPTVTCPSNMIVCSSSAPFALTGGSPAGGTYSGPGVSGNTFDPAFAGPGSHTITYSYTSNGCTVSCNFIITVKLVSGSVTGSATVPQGVGTSNITFSGNGGQPNYTFVFTVTINGVTGPQQTISTTNGNSSITVSQSNAIAGTYTYTLLSVTDNFGCAGSISPATATITVSTAAGLPGPDLTSSQLFTTLQVSPGNIIEEVIVIRNVGGGPTTGPIVFNITNYNALSGLTVTSSAASSIIIGPDTYILDNANWTFDPAVGTFTSNQVIPAGSSRNIGLRIARGTGGNAGANGAVTQTTTIPPGTGGGEAPTTNNTISNTLLKVN